MVTSILKKKEQRPAKRLGNSSGEGGAEFFVRSPWKCETASQVAEIANGVSGADTVTANYVQFWFIYSVLELKIDHKAVLSHLRKVGFKKMLHVWVPHQLTPKNMIDRISICEALAKWNEIDPFLKWIVTGDEKWVTYYNIVRTQSWSKCGEAAQTVAKPGLTARKVLLRIWWD
ncbi:histone-lysine N-methyltransferase SETMAR [Trichonephila clavipes]|nr:histone-lysine N-methyltransferase SETMAR [Trichonephila clavipes]